MLGRATMGEVWQTVAIRSVAALLLWAALAIVAPVLGQESGEIPVGDRSILISLADRRLYLLENGERARSFPVAIGRPGVEIPLGDSAIVRKRRNPTWRPTANQRRADPSLPVSVPPGPDNPLGRHALDLGWSAIAIHGTNNPESIGRRASGGCFRMMPADIETLFQLTVVGTPVRVIREPVGDGPARPVPVAAKPVPSASPGAPQTSSPRLAVPTALAAAPAIAPAALAVPEPPPPVVPDPRCPSASAPLRRLICDTPELALLDGKARGVQKRFLDGLAEPRVGDRGTPNRAAVAYVLSADERRFEDRISALCWVRKGTEADPAIAAAARKCLSTALSGRLEDVIAKVVELRSKQGSTLPLTAAGR